MTSATTAILRVLPALAIAALALLGAARQSAAQITFTQGDLVVSVEGDGSGDAANGTGATGNTGASADIYQDNQAAPLTLYELTTAGTQVGSLELPQTTSGSNSAISGEYGSSSEGTLELTGNGQDLLIAGYGTNAAQYNSTSDLNGTGTALAQSCSLSVVANCDGVPQVPRVIAEIGANGSVNTSTVLYNVFNENNPRSVASVNGTTLYISGQGTGYEDPSEGVFVTTLGSTSAQALYNTYDTRTLEIYNNQLYTSVDTKQGSGQTAFIGTVGSGLPTSGATYPNSGPQTVTPLPGLSSGSKNSPLSGKIALSNGNGNNVNGSTGNIYLSPENYFFANSTTLYVADSGDPKAGNGDGTDSDGGLQKWSLVNGTWVLDYTLSTGLDLVPYNSTCAVDTASLTENENCTTGLEGLTGEVLANGDVELYATTFTLGDDNASYLYAITDVLGDTEASQVTGEDFTELAEAPADSDFKGVAFAPVPEPSSLAILATGIALMRFGRRFRRPLG